MISMHEAVKHGDLGALRALLAADRSLANARIPTDARGIYPLHVAAQFGQAAAARLLIEHGADVNLLDTENEANALCWAAFFGRPEAARVLVEAGSGLNRPNKHGLTPLACAQGGVEGRWRQFSNATMEDWRKCVSLLS